MKVYTYNDKVLVNSANDKWLKEKEAPADETSEGGEEGGEGESTEGGESEGGTGA